MADINNFPFVGKLRREKSGTEGEIVMVNIKPDIRAKITLTQERPVYSGYRPAHLIGDYLTTGVQEYFNTDILKSGETAEGTITFLSPEHYPRTLKVGMRLVFQDGSKIAGYAEILEIYNEILKM